MKAPAFWSAGDRSLWPALLAPLAGIYGLAQDIRRRYVSPVKAGLPVVCIGNLVAGGAGKTPAAMAIAQILAGAGWKVHFLSRGYGGKLAGPVRVDPAIHDYRDVGDEPLLLASMAPCWVAHDRVQGARAAQAGGAEVIVLDDGFQNPKLYKDCAIVVIDAGFGFGNGKLMPAGPLREPVSTGLARADAVMLVGEGDNFPGQELLDRSKPLLRGILIPTEESLRLTGARVVAFAGIGRPQKFFDSLQRAGCKIVQSYAFADHQPYDVDSFMAMVDTAAALSATLVTTRKDYMRLDAAQRKMVDVFDVVLHLKAADEIETFLLAAIRQKH